MAVQTFKVGDRVRHRAELDFEMLGTVTRVGRGGWIRVSWDSGQVLYHPDVNLVKE